jgi:hypothetical protein
MNPSMREQEGREHAIAATAWFSVLMHTKASGKLQEAAKAQRELEELGVQVRFRRPRPEAPRAS